MSVAVDDYDSAVAFLMGRINYEQTTKVPYGERTFKLQRMERLLEALGNPHFNLKVIHVAGTKGKGSTAHMIETMLRAGGLRTGLYTSPHLSRVEERFALDGAACSEAIFMSAAASAFKAVNQLEAASSDSDDPSCATYFEITTAMAMLIFAQANVDIAVLEVGLGGRLDSTNVCRPLVSVISSISYDHTQQLGNTLASIAREKAGIIKPGVPVISGVMQPEASAVISQAAADHSSPLRQLNVDFGVDVEQPHASSAPAGLRPFRYWEQAPKQRLTIGNLSLSMLGQHQTENAALAIAAVRQLDSQHASISEAAIRRGIAQARCAARIEVLCTKPVMLVDAAHNVASATALVDVIEDHFAEVADRTLILSTSDDKDVRGMLAVLLPHFSRAILTRYESNPRSAQPEALRKLATEVCSQAGQQTQATQRCVVEVAESPVAALRAFQDTASQNTLLCATGSFYLAAELRHLMQAMSVASGDQNPLASSDRT